jgi:hypothetical protein
MDFNLTPFGLTSDSRSYINHNTLSDYNLATHEQLLITFKCSTSDQLCNGVNFFSIDQKSGIQAPSF